MASRILYIDDDPAVARLAERVLGRNGFEVVHAPSVALGLELFQSQTFDAVVLDHYFQTGTGMNFLTSVSDSINLVPILYVTGSSEAQIAIDALKGGAADYVIKTAADDFFPLLLNSLQQALDNFRLRKEKEETDRLLVAAKDRAELMVAEMNHRIANSLALVSAMIRMQMNSESLQETRSALAETQSRIAAIAGVHRSLYTSENVGTVELSTYISSLTSDLKNAAPSATAVDITTQLEPMTVSADRAVAIGVIVTELITNALKYAYADGAGQIRVKLGQTDDQCLLIIEDDGVGIDESSQPKGTGLGTKLIKAMSQSLSATTTYDRCNVSGAPGVSVHITWPRDVETVKTTA